MEGEDSRCKSPALGVGLVCLRRDKEARVAGAGSWVEMGSEAMGSSQARASGRSWLCSE